MPKGKCIKQRFDYGSGPIGQLDSNWVNYAGSQASSHYGEEGIEVN